MESTMQPDEEHPSSADQDAAPATASEEWETVTFPPPDLPWDDVPASVWAVLGVRERPGRVPYEEIEENLPTWETKALHDYEPPERVPFWEAKLAALDAAFTARRLTARHYWRYLRKHSPAKEIDLRELRATLLTRLAEARHDAQLFEKGEGRKTRAGKRSESLRQPAKSQRAKAPAAPTVLPSHRHRKRYKGALAFLKMLEGRKGKPVEGSELSDLRRALEDAGIGNPEAVVKNVKDLLKGQWGIDPRGLGASGLCKVVWKHRGRLNKEATGIL